MKAKQILTDSLKMLGYVDSNGNGRMDARITNSAVVFINKVYSDLWYIVNSKRRKQRCWFREIGHTEEQTDERFVPCESLDSEIDLPEEILYDVMPYGVAYYIAGAENDGDNEQKFSVLYKQKRGKLTFKKSYIDVMPRSYDL